jgi:hypothetical protein
MALRLLAPVIVLLALLPSTASAVELDPGGFSVSFGAAGEVAVAGDEMLRNPGMESLDAAGRPQQWLVDHYVWLPTQDNEAQRRMLKRLAPLFEWGSSPQRPHSGKQAMRLRAPLSAYLPSDPPHEFCAMFHQAVPLRAIEAPTRYLLTWHYRGDSPQDIPNSRAYVRVSFYDDADLGKAQSTRGYAQEVLAASPDWRRGQLEFTAPGNTRCLDVRLALTGPGEACYDDVSLKRVAIQEHGVSARIMPAAYVDNLFCLSSGDVGTMCFGFRNETGQELVEPRLVLRLPEGIEVLETAPTVKLSQRPIAGQTEFCFDISPIKSRIHDGTFGYPYNQWEGLQVLVRTRRAPGSTRLEGRYWMEDGSYRGALLEFGLQVLPPLPKVTGPKRFHSGAHLYLVNQICRPEAVKAFAKLFEQVGFNCVHSPGAALGIKFGRDGLVRFAQPLGNGYAMGDATPNAKPADAVFRKVDGTPLWEAICPTEVYQRGPYFPRQIVNGMLRDILVKDRSAEQLMCNWEPFMYVGQGCFCSRCKAEFAAYSKLSREELEPIWPADVIKRHPDLWTRFRSWQHGKLMATLEEETQRLGREIGRDTHFIPEIYYGLLLQSWAKEAHNRDYAAVDYLDRLPVLNAWAPYNWFIFGRGPYDYVRGRHLNIHITASEIQQFVAQRLPPGKRTQLYAFPYGSFEGATEPEAIAFEMMTYFLHGYRGAIVYLWPGGSDARYWRALAECNRQMALIEPYVCGVASVNRHTITAETPLPKPDPRFLDGFGPVDDPHRWRNLPLVLSWEFAQGETRLIAVGNFWEQGECFFRLKPQDLRPAQRYVLREPATGRVFVGQEGDSLTAAELGSGILLHVGAMRYACFVLEPYRPGSRYVAMVRPKEMERAKAERLRAR